MIYLDSVVRVPPYLLISGRVSELPPVTGQMMYIAFYSHSPDVSREEFESFRVHGVTKGSQDFLNRDGSFFNSNLKSGDVLYFRVYPVNAISLYGGPIQYYNPETRSFVLTGISDAAVSPVMTVTVP